MSNETTQLALYLDAGPESDEKELAELTRQLRDELLDLDLESVDLVSNGVLPPKSKVVEPLTLGALLLTLAASGGVITTLINAIQSWLTRHDRRSVTLEIDGDKLEVGGISPEEQQRLIDAWAGRHFRRLSADD